MKITLSLNAKCLELEKIVFFSAHDIDFFTVTFDLNWQMLIGRKLICRFTNKIYFNKVTLSIYLYV